MILRFILSICFLVSLTSYAVACSCVGISNKSVGEHIGTDVVFVGTPILTRLKPNEYRFDNTVVTTFEIDRMFRGNPEKRKVEISHRQDGAACGVWFTLGERQLVSAYDTDGGLSTGSCANPLPDMVVINYFEKHEDVQLMSRWSCEERGLLPNENYETEDKTFSIASNPCLLYRDDSRRRNWKAWKSWLRQQNF
ncbi:MAG: hypothetical protein ABJN22_10735 [Litorimonas sp.]